MKYATAASFAAMAISGASAQGVAAGTLLPSGSPPAGCQMTAEGQYQITVVKPSAMTKRDLEKRQTCDPSGNSLIISLNGGVLTDSKGRIGGIIAGNRQFQFDGPPSQTGTLYNGGFSMCGNSSLAIGSSTEFYQCLSGSFYNLYDQPQGAQCAPVRLNTLKCDAAGAGAGAPPASSMSSSASTSAATQATDGQPQASSATSVVSQASDGQPTAPPATTAATPTTAATVVSQVSDGQIQGPTAPVVSQISDGQPQATAASNATISAAKPTSTIATGGAAGLVSSGALVGVVAIAAFFL